MNTLSNVALGLFLTLFLGSASAQSKELVDEKELAGSMTQLAKSINTEVRGMTAKVSALPNDLHILETFYDEMIAYMDSLLSSVGPDTDLTKDVTRMKTDAEIERDNWQKLCDRQSKQEDCHYATLWTDEVATMIQYELSFFEIVSDIEKTREQLLDRKKYTIADLKLGQYDNAIIKLGQSLGKIKILSNTIVKLSVEIGGEKFALMEEQ